MDIFAGEYLFELCDDPVEYWLGTLVVKGQVRVILHSVPQYPSRLQVRSRVLRLHFRYKGTSASS